MAMVFTLVTVLKDSAELLISERQNAKQALADIEAAKIEEEENRKFQGEAVTRELPQVAGRVPQGNGGEEEAGRRGEGG